MYLEEKQLPLLHPHLLIPFNILLRNKNLLAENLLRLPAYINLRDVAGDIGRVTFERGLLDIGIEAAGTTDTDFIAAHDVRHEHLVVDGLTLVDILIHVVVAGLVKGCLKGLLTHKALQLHRGHPHPVV